MSPFLTEFQIGQILFKSRTESTELMYLDFVRYHIYSC